MPGFVLNASRRNTPRHSTFSFANYRNQNDETSSPLISARMSHSLNVNIDGMPLDQASSAYGITPIPEFEPVVNVPAASAFFVIAVVFTLLQLRINAISDAAKRRSRALEALRRAESLQLSGASMGLHSSERSNELDVSSARDDYERALREELNLREIMPGVRIVAPNDPKREEEQRYAAKRFLGWDANEFDDEDDKTNIRKVEEIDGDQRDLTVVAKLVLFGVASALILLLWTLSFDPMSPSFGSFTSSMLLIK